MNKNVNNKKNYQKNSFFFLHFRQTSFQKNLKYIIKTCKQQIIE